MKTLYLTQCAGGLPSFYKWMGGDYVLLSFIQKTAETHLYAPGSTWTEGRNLLREYVLSDSRLLSYDYFCFMDGDLIAESGMNWRDLEREIYKRNCKIALPRLWNYSRENRGIGVDYLDSKNPSINPDKYLYQTVDWFDAACNYFSREVFIGDLIFPYWQRFDSSSWQTSQFVLIVLSNHHYKNEVMQFNSFKIPENIEHSDYPKNAKFADAYCEVLDSLKLDSISLSDVRGFCRVGACGRLIERLSKWWGRITIR
jgi:hypothetical protein